MKKSKSLILIALLLLVGVTSGYVANTYARYTATLNPKAATATVAKWAFEEDNANTQLVVNLGDYATANLVEGRIAPGTEGSFAVELSNANTETGVEYTISFSDVAGIPTNLKFYTDDTYGTEIDLANEEITGILAPNAQDEETVAIYWQWPYLEGEDAAVDTNNAEDTANGETGGESGTKLTFNMNITGVQVDPESDGNA